MSSEDKLVNRIIEHHSNRDRIIRAEPEAHYEYYGYRGTADLFLRWEHSDGSGEHDDVYEVKSASAVESSTGANEILRQFNKMRKYFYEDDSHSPARSEVNFRLVFTISETTVRHVANNLPQYTNAIDAGVTDIRSSESRVSSYILMRPHDEDFGVPVLLFNTEGERPSSVDEWYQYVDKRNTVSYNRVKEILDKINY